MIRKLIRADRLGLWDVHLDAIQEALPIFPAAGHFNYTKSAYLYLQSMRNLENTNPEVLQCFQDGGFVARRSEKHWAGLACDLTIEQALMRSLKTSGGLTRGTGFSDAQRSTWCSPNRYVLGIHSTWRTTLVYFIQQVSNIKH